ncbi:hypothetical protein [Methylobacterium sp. CCH5-D2]|uniref:hypothetical protein n=1 Tax=Methylobacterium sp. CCH5-D2 TaxID=1768765 RepID=UPI001FD8A826|nr:hypothetical protein [Methylobacterium sp. CCH5-D2]
MTKRELADAISNAMHMPDRATLAAFALDPVTAFASNPFARTSAAAVKHTWTVQAFEFPVRDIQAAGLSSLLQAVSALPGTERLMQEILRAGPHTLNAFYHGERREIVGAVLYGRPHVPLPVFTSSAPTRPKRAQRASAAQLDLFAVEA